MLASYVTPDFFLNFHYIVVEVGTAIALLISIYKWIINEWRR